VRRPVLRVTPSLKIERVTPCTFQPQLERVDVRAFHVFTERALKTAREILIDRLELFEPLREAHRFLSGLISVPH
jgi:hypothetical protein